MKKYSKISFSSLSLFFTLFLCVSTAFANAQYHALCYTKANSKVVYKLTYNDNTEDKDKASQLLYTDGGEEKGYVQEIVFNDVVVKSTDEIVEIKLYVEDRDTPLVTIELTESDWNWLWEKRDPKLVAVKIARGTQPSKAGVCWLNYESEDKLSEATLINLKKNHEYSSISHGKQPKQPSKQCCSTLGKCCSAIGQCLRSCASSVKSDDSDSTSSQFFYDSISEFPPSPTSSPPSEHKASTGDE